MKEEVLKPEERNPASEHASPNSLQADGEFDDKPIKYIAINFQPGVAKTWTT